ncbi:MAG: hypothetical protein ACOC2L_04350 [Candidatus Sumerlaeota bacterium]
MSIEVAGEVFLSQRELSDLGVRKFFRTVRLGPDNFVPWDDVAAEVDLSRENISPDRCIPLEEAADIIGLPSEEFRDFIVGDELVPRVRAFVYRNCWYVYLEDMKKLDPRFDTEGYLTLEQAADELETEQEVLEPFLTQYDQWPKKVDGKVYVRRDRVELLARQPPFDRKRFLSAYEASIELKVETNELRKQASKGRFRAKKVGSEWYMPREEMEALRAASG